MRRIVPSQIVQFIDTALPTAVDAQNKKLAIIINHQYIGFVRGLSDLLLKIDDLLLPMGTDAVTLQAATSEIRATLESWTRGNRDRSTRLEKMPGYGENPVIVIRRILEKCHDSAVSPSISGLEFISDPIYRERLREDLASIENLFEARQWKATMVLAGSLIEALLCDQIIQKSEVDREQAITELMTLGELKSKPSSDPLQWHLPLYLKVAESLSLISKKTKEQATLSTEYRNLVHPGRELREKISCNKASTFSVLAGLEHVIDDLVKCHHQH